MSSLHIETGGLNDLQQKIIQTTPTERFIDLTIDPNELPRITHSEKSSPRPIPEKKRNLIGKTETVLKETKVVVNKSTNAQRRSKITTRAKRNVKYVYSSSDDSDDFEYSSNFNGKRRARKANRQQAANQKKLRSNSVDTDTSNTRQNQKNQIMPLPVVQENFESMKNDTVALIENTVDQASSISKSKLPEKTFSQRSINSKINQAKTPTKINSSAIFNTTKPSTSSQKSDFVIKLNRFFLNRKKSENNQSKNVAKGNNATVINSKENEKDQSKFAKPSTSNYQNENTKSKKQNDFIDRIEKALAENRAKNSTKINKGNERYKTVQNKRPIYQTKKRKFFHFFV